MTEVSLNTVALQMYKALANLPCGCCRKWKHDIENKTEYTVTHVCEKHRAMRAYEQLVALEMT